MTDGAGYLIAAYAAVWLGVVGYGAWMGLQLRRVRHDLDALSRIVDQAQPERHVDR